MKVAILGYARQGISSYEHWLEMGHEVTICDLDKNKETPKGALSVLGEEYLSGLDQYDLLVRTGRIHPSQIVNANPDAPDILAKVTSATNEFFKLTTTPIIGITGTKGKGTTTLLVAEILRQADKKILVAGNIGTSPLAILKEAETVDVVVLELSNFQTIDMQYSPNIGVCVKVGPEHLDWHTDYDEYVQSKAQMFAFQKPEDLKVYNYLSEDSVKIVSASSADRSYGYEVLPENNEPTRTQKVYVDDDKIMVDGSCIASVSDVKLLGRHNLENVCAAIAAVWDLIDHNPEPIITALHKSPGFEHRIEPVRTVNGIKYINDSFASAPDATIAALFENLITAARGQKGQLPEEP